MKENISIRIQSQDRTIHTEPGISLLQGLMHHGIILRSDCGGKGKCGKCRVDILGEDGTSQPVNSCTYTLDRDITIMIPPSSIPPNFFMGKAGLSFPQSFRQEHRAGKAGMEYGIAIDLGTTTMAVYLCDIQQGEVLSSLAMKNPQALYGADVMSRITAITEDEQRLGELQHMTVSDLELGMKTLLSAFTGTPPSISKMVVVGNPAMIHILTQTNPRSIGIAPYQPTLTDAGCFQSRELNFTLGDFPVHTLPNMSGFLGGDILSAAQAADMESQPHGTLLIDLGTNGELLIKSQNGLYATSCATGPAFEGATLSCGIQAVPGAVSAVDIDETGQVTHLDMVTPSDSGKIQPCGICGSGVINAVAQFCRTGIIKPGGAFQSGADRFVLVPEDSKSGQQSIYISQKDIRSVQLGKSALITGITFLMKKAGVKELNKLLIAGAFGSFLRTADLKRLGMIPDIDNEKIFVEGNLAGTGAVMALCHSGYIRKTTDMAARIETLELALDPEFQAAFVENLNFPD